MILELAFTGRRIQVPNVGSFSASQHRVCMQVGQYRLDTAQANALSASEAFGFRPRGGARIHPRNACVMSSIEVGRPIPLCRINADPGVNLFSPASAQYFLGDRSALLHRSGIQVSSEFIVHLQRMVGGGLFQDIQMRITPPEAPWMQTASDQLGTSEVPGSRANPRILEFFQASRFWGTDDSGGANAWCGSFVAWVMSRHAYEPPDNAFRARSWENFGSEVNTPVYGAIGVKSRRGGGHVAFVAGKSPDGRHLYMLGGNQSDEVNIRRYPRNVWHTFVLPTGYRAPVEALPVYNGEAELAGAEE